MGRRCEPVPTRTGTTGEERTDHVAFFAVLSLPVLAFVDWAVAWAVVRAVRCELYERGGVLDCGGSPAMAEAFTVGTLSAVPVLALQMWLIGLGLRRIRNGSRLTGRGRRSRT